MASVAWQVYVAAFTPSVLSLTKKVQIPCPCIERNAMGAVQALNAAKLRMLGRGEHQVSLYAAVEAMMRTGRAGKRGS